MGEVRPSAPIAPGRLPGGSPQRSGASLPRALTERLRASSPGLPRGAEASRRKGRPRWGHRSHISPRLLSAGARLLSRTAAPRRRRRRRPGTLRRSRLRGPAAVAGGPDTPTDRASERACSRGTERDRETGRRAERQRSPRRQRHGHQGEQRPGVGRRRRGALCASGPGWAGGGPGRRGCVPGVGGAGPSPDPAEGRTEGRRERRARASAPLPRRAPSRGRVDSRAGESCFSAVFLPLRMTVGPRSRRRPRELLLQPGRPLPRFPRARGAAGRWERPRPAAGPARSPPAAPAADADPLGGIRGWLRRVSGGSPEPALCDLLIASSDFTQEKKRKSDCFVRFFNSICC